MCVCVCVGVGVGVGGWVCVGVCVWVGVWVCVCNMCIYISISLVSAMKRNFQTGF